MMLATATAITIHSKLLDCANTKEPAIAETISTTSISTRNTGLD